ncbi:MAG: amidase family protein [Saprospiraceae bacterium]
MKTNFKKLAKWLGIIIGVLALLVGGLVLYVWSQLPKADGEPPILQTELFQKPKTELPCEGKYIFKSATELATLIKTRKASSVEITTEFINYIKNNNYKTNAFVWLFEKEALEAAKRADEITQRAENTGLLHGVPVCIKEEFWVKGHPSTWNSSQFQNFMAPRNAAIVDAWLAEGAVILGTTNVPRMLIDMQTAGEIYPEAHNPYDVKRTPGGSTGGGAAAVASAFCPLSLGGDMGGSIRVPAAYCGIYGLKTTEESMGRHFGSSPDTTGNHHYYRLAVAGPMARTIDDIDLGWKALIKPWYQNNKWLVVDTTKSLSSYKIAWFGELQLPNDKISVSSDVLTKLNQLVSNLNKEGVNTNNVQPPKLAEMRQMHMLLMAYMVFAKQPWIIRQLIKHEFESGTPLKIDMSEGLERIGDADEEEYEKILKRREALKQSLEDFFKQYDFLIMPITIGPAMVKNPNHEPIEINGKNMEYWDQFHYPMFFNATGHPALTIPLGLNDQGLPIAVQLVGPMFSEQRLIHFAKMIEKLHEGYVAPK